jgi:transcriptional regulator with XRE-family HTH domain
MRKPTPVVLSRNQALGQALKLLRRLRGRRPGELAVLIGISRRSYEYFEAGRGPLNVDRVHRFAQILDVDPFAILAAMEIRSPQFALQCAEHKLMTIMTVAVQEFDAAAGDAIGRLNAATIISGLTRVFDALMLDPPLKLRSNVAAMLPCGVERPSLFRVPAQTSGKPRRYLKGLWDRTSRVTASPAVERTCSMSARGG